VEVVEPIKSSEHVAVVELKAAPVMAVQPTGEEIAIAEVVAPVAAPTAMAATLPATAGNLPLIALAGLLALGGALAAGAAAKRNT